MYVWYVSIYVCACGWMDMHMCMRAATYVAANRNVFMLNVPESILARHIPHASSSIQVGIGVLRSLLVLVLVLLRRYVVIMTSLIVVRDGG